MSDERKETVSDIMSEMREYADSMEKHLIYDLSECSTDYLRVLADRIEEAVNRQFRDVTKMIQYEEVAVSKMETTTPTREKSSQVGNAAAMREALEAAIPIMRACLFDYYNTTDVNKVVGEMKAALSAPPRNCDVGTTKEQSARFDAHCRKNMGCLTCPLREKDGGVPKHCEFAWSQMPYEEGGAE